MPSFGNRQVIIAILLAATMVLAGCSGGGPTTETPDGSTDDGGANADVSASAYVWQEGESYTYEGSASGGTSSQYSWDVTDVSDEDVTVKLTSAFGGRSQTSNLTGPQGDIFNGSEQTPPQSLTFILLQIPNVLVQDHTLQSGNSWTVSSGDLEMSGMEDQGRSEQIDVSVTGTSQVAGTECYNMEASSPNQTVSSCIKEGWPFALSMTMELETRMSSGGETETRTQTTSYTLVEYDRP